MPDEKIRTRFATEISENLRVVIGSKEVGEFIGGIVKTVVNDCIGRAVSEATEELKKEILALNKVIVELKTKQDVVKCQHNKQSDSVIVSKSKTKPNTISNVSKDSSTMESSAGPTYAEALPSGTPATDGKVEEADMDLLAKDGQDNEDAFHVVRHKRQKRNFVVGTKLNTGLGVAEKEVYLHVWRLHASTTEEDILQYIQSGQPGIKVKCERLNARANYSSFKLVTSESAYGELTDPEFWPVGVAIDRFLIRRPSFPKVK